MIAHTEFQAMGARGFTPQADDVFLRTHVYGVPAIVSGVPKVEVIVMYSHAHEVLGASFLVQADQIFGIELCALPKGNQILIAEFRGMSVMVEVILVLALA